MEIALVLTILVAAVFLFITEKFSVDLVAILVLAALLGLGLVTPEQGISGFSNPATITVAAMFVLSAGLQKTGAVRVVGRAFIRLSRYPTALLLMMMVTVGVVSAFVNNTAAVAVFLPMVMAAAGRSKISASKLLIPLSFAAQFGGVCTLMGSSTNLLVSAISDRAGLGAFTLFEFSRMGLILVGAGVIYFLVVGRWLVPARRGEKLVENYHLREYITELRVMAGSPLIGKSVRESELRKDHDVTVLGILRGEQKIWSPYGEELKQGDVLLVEGAVKNLMELKDRAKLEIEPEFRLRDETLKAEDQRLVEALIAPRSRLIGHILSGLDFRRLHRVIVLAIQRRQRTLREKLGSVRLEFGDSLLLQGPEEEIDRLRRDDNFIVLEEVEGATLRKGKAPLAILIIALVVGLDAANLLPIMISAILGCAAMALTRCISLEDAYEAIDWKVIFLLAGLLPLGIAFENSGAAEFVTQHSMNLVAQFGPVVVLAVVYLLTAVLTEFMSNNASAVLLAPIAISTAVNLGVHPKPFLMAVTFAASTSFATTVGYQTNTMIYGPGGYKFTDFMKVGIPLNLLFCGLGVYFIPRFWPF